MRTIPLSLKQAVLEGRCIPFVGAGVSMGVTKRNAPQPLFPSWTGLLLACASRLEDDGKTNDAVLIRALVDPASTTDYMYAAQRARAALGAVWYRLLADQFDPPPEDADPRSLAIAEAVWAINRNLVITTNYDRVLHWTCPQPRDLQVWTIESPAGMANMDLRRMRPTIWHLHGSISDASSLILTPNSYQLLYSSDDSRPRYQAALHTLQRTIASKSLLFIGFSADDEALAAQLKHIEAIFAGAGGPHYVLVHADHAERIRSKGLPLQLLELKNFDDDQHALLNEIAACNARQTVAELGSSPVTAPLSPARGVARAGAELRPALRHTYPPGIAAPPTHQRVLNFVTQPSTVAQASTAALAAFRRQLRKEAQTELSDALDDNALLQRLGCLTGGRLNVAGVLMFSDAPSVVAPIELQSAFIQCVVYEGATKASARSRQQFNGPILSQMEKARAFVVRNTPSVEMPSPESMTAQVQYRYPMVCLREVIANALCHRDYSDPSRITYVRMFADRVEIASAGDWPAAASQGPEPAPIDHIHTQSVQGNMLLTHLVSMVSVVEMEGSGIPTAVQDCFVNEAPMPTVTCGSGYVTVTVFPCKSSRQPTGRRRLRPRAEPSDELRMAHDALVRAESMHDQLAIIATHVRLAEVFFDDERYDKCIESADAAITLASAMNQITRVGGALLIRTKALSRLST